MSEPVVAEAAAPPTVSAEAPGNPPTPAKKDSKDTKPAEDGAPKKLSGAELKKLKQAEKQAKRAQAKAAGPPTVQQGGPSKENQKKKEQKQPQQKDDNSRPLPVRRRPSQSNVVPQLQTKKDSKRSQKELGLFFGHLYSQPRQHSMVGASKDAHPAVLALGLQYSSYAICGSTARMVAMLLAFKAVIESYQTPPGTSLARHLTNHHLSPQIDYLRSCRPLSISMGNAIRWLKDIIIKIDPSTPEAEAKRDLAEEIDMFIRERVTAAQKLIRDQALTKILPGDVILTYASSSIVEQTLLQAHKAGVPFTVIVVDSKPLFEGKTLARKLANQGINVRYYLITGASHAVKDASKVFLGAHAMMSNGRLYSRVGTALVSMLARAHSLPVIVLCESVKFTEKVALDSIVGNEVAPADEILSETERSALLPLEPHLPPTHPAKTKDDDKTAAEGTKFGSLDVLKWIEGSENLHHLQVLYDVTPAEYINMVITEYGSLPPSSVPVVHRLSTNT
ncbi:nagb/rpia/CoA transferase-like protein [Bimuria novae-zelandiae CBS 107.79]|uniref:Translation initiation factor eIF2B subunit delta n=1 Tax=Bimuria novae-zelandiae CBS 107.79 TaxID=1447943 RepID=A0A6A5VAT0_9PLEO|nr:nagb/rpia/CoA transferase-like protein [Bimuria novae-zelandiae CBS 107.79]